jgi:hypothetical protein
MCYDTDNYWRLAPMEFWLGILVGLVVGLMMRRSSSGDAGLRDKIRQELELSAQDQKDPAVAEGVRKAAMQVGNPLLYGSNLGETRVEKESTVPTAEAPVWSHDVKGLDSVSVLLYFGAFLMIAGVGLFVGLSDFSGGVKTTAVLITAVVFYGAGLLMHEYVKRLRPVALTLTAIGLICLPLTGVAAYFYATDMSSGPFIWFMTSLASLLLYVFALWRIRQSLMGYLSIFMCVSLWLSIVSVISAPVYYFGWAAITLAMVYLLTAKYLKLWPEVEAPLSVSATVMVPSALVLTFLFGIGTVGLTNFGITVLLATLFYALAAWQEKNESVRTAYFGLSYALLPVATLLLMQEFTSEPLAMAWVLSVVTILEFAVASIWKKTHEFWYQAALAMSAVALGISSLIAPPYFSADGDWAQYCWLLGFNMVVHGVTAFVSRYRLHALMSLLALLVLPSLAGYFVFTPVLPVATMGATYIVLGVALMLLGHKVRSFGFYDLTALAYGLSLLAAWSIGLAGATWVPMALSLCVGLVVAVSAMYEKAPRVLYGSTVLGAAAVVQLCDWQQPKSASVLPLLIGGLSLAYYAVGKLLKNYEAYTPPLLLSGVAGLYAAACVAAAATNTSWTTISLLAAAGALTCYEAYVRKQRAAIYIGGGVMLAAFQLSLYLSHVREAEVYWHLWALYFAALAWLSHRSKRSDEKQIFTISALCLQTLPLALRALDGDTQLGFVLLAESVLIMLLGLGIRYRLVSWWGLAVAVGSVLYQLREFQFFVLVLLGAGVIGLGVYLLLRQEKKD